MSSEVSVSGCGTWVHTCVSGPITFESALEFIERAAEKASAHRLDSFLFDVRGASNTKRPSHDFDITHNHLRRLGYSGFSRVVLLVSAGDKSHEFFELTASNAGHNWRVLESEGAALEWLRR